MIHVTSNFQSIFKIRFEIHRVQGTYLLSLDPGLTVDKSVKEDGSPAPSPHLSAQAHGRMLLPLPHSTMCSTHRIQTKVQTIKLYPLSTLQMLFTSSVKKVLHPPLGVFLIQTLPCDDRNPNRVGPHLSMLPKHLWTFTFLIRTHQW